jgi:hypothetical protein
MYNTANVDDDVIIILMLLWMMTMTAARLAQLFEHFVREVVD